RVQGQRPSIGDGAKRFTSSAAQAERSREGARRGACRPGAGGIGAAADSEARRWPLTRPCRPGHDAPSQKNLERTVVRLEVKGGSWPPENIARGSRTGKTWKPARRGEAMPAGRSHPAMFGANLLPSGLY